MAFSLKPFMLDVWLLEQLSKATWPGPTLEELKERWTSDPRHSGVLNRSTLTRHREDIKEFFGVVIDTPDKKHYRIKNPEALALDTLANDLLASVQEYLFLDEYRDLGDRIQPQQILAGREYLQTIGNAIRDRKKLKIRYQKFTDDEPYDAILHPYCLKACIDRWYILAVKEGSERKAQTFALDRIHSLHILQEKYKVDETINVKTYFKDAFGIWVEKDKYPVRDIQVTVPTWVSKYWKTLPLHDSQKVIKQDNETVTFQFHLSPTPDFLGELKRWGVEIKT